MDNNHILEKLKTLDAESVIALQLKLNSRGDDLKKQLNFAQTTIDQLQQVFGEAEEVHTDQHRGVIYIRAGYNFVSALLQEKEIFDSVEVEEENITN